MSYCLLYNGNFDFDGKCDKDDVRCGKCIQAIENYKK